MRISPGVGGWWWVVGGVRGGVRGCVSLPCRGSGELQRISVQNTAGARAGEAVRVNVAGKTSESVLCLPEPKITLW